MAPITYDEETGERTTLVDKNLPGRNILSTGGSLQYDGISLLGKEKSEPSRSSSGESESRCRKEEILSVVNKKQYYIVVALEIANNWGSPRFVSQPVGS